jgi:hypothetical protein
MGPVLTILTAVFLLILALLDTQASGLVSISSTLMLELITLSLVSMLLTLYRVSRAAR